jgi:acetoin utilization deacetylase AcuC-like enzyme
MITWLQHGHLFSQQGGDVVAGEFRQTPQAVSAFEHRDDPTVFYYSIHEHPTFAFPGTGREFEFGSGPGYGYTKNNPVLPGQGDAEYTALVEETLAKDFERFHPGFMLVSTGFDGHKDDDMSDMNLTTEWYSWVMKRIMEIADHHCNGRIVSVLEGGYCLRRLPELARNHVAALLGE